MVVLRACAGPAECTLQGLVRVLADVAPKPRRTLIASSSSDRLSTPMLKSKILRAFTQRNLFQRKAQQRRRRLNFELLELRLPLSGEPILVPSLEGEVIGGQFFQGQLSPEPIVLSEEEIEELAERQEEGGMVMPQDPETILSDVDPSQSFGDPLIVGGNLAPDLAAVSASSFTLGQLTGLSSSATGGQTSDIAEPNVGTLGSAVFQTGNWYASVSGDGGNSFQFVNPFTNWYPSGVTDPLGRFCCDQRVAQAPAQNLTIWYLQFDKGVRIAVANGTSDLLQNRWTFYNFTPASFGFSSNQELDYPTMQVTNSNLYVSSNVCSNDSCGSAVVFRLPLSSLAAAASVSPRYFTTTSPSVVLANGASTRMYMGAVESSSTFRVFSWDDSSTSFSNQLITGLNTTFGSGRGSHIAPGPDHNNWLSRDDERAKTAWLTGNSLGFMWDSGQGTNRPYPFIRTLTLDASTLAVTGQPDIWNANFAFAYPAIAVNARGAIAGSLMVGGGSLVPEVDALIKDDLSNPVNSLWELYSIAKGTNGDPNGWGDYLGAQTNAPLPNTWAAVGYVLNGQPVPPGNFNSNIKPYYFTMGRGRDFPVPTPVTVVTGNGIGISNNDGSPQAADGTDFGSVNVGGFSGIQTFVVGNTGTGDLLLNGIFQSIIIGGPNAGDFELFNDILNNNIPPGGTQNFQIRFRPTAGGTRNATVSFSSNDPQNSTFAFSISGTGNAFTGPRIEVSASGQVITDGDNSPSEFDGTDFGVVGLSQVSTATFSIRNAGSTTLNLTGSPLVQKSGTNAADFSIGQPSASSIAPGGTVTFQLSFTPSANGLRTATVSIPNSDSSQLNPFQFAVQGTGGTVTTSSWKSIGPAPQNGGLGGASTLR